MPANHVLRAAAEGLGGMTVDVGIAPVGAEDDDGVGQALQDTFQASVALAQGSHRPFDSGGGPLPGRRQPRPFHLFHDLMGKRAERPFLVHRERPGHPVYDAQGAEGVSAGRDQGDARVEADARLARHQRVVGETGVGVGVGDDEEIRLENGVGAEGRMARGFGDGEAETGLEPLPVGGNQGNGGRGRTADVCGEAHDFIAADVTIGPVNLSLVATVVPFGVEFFNFFIGTIQAFVFTLLTIVYLSLATQGHDDEHHA